MASPRDSVCCAFSAIARIQPIAMIIECQRCHLRYDASGKPVGSRVKCRCGNTLTVPAGKPAAVALHCPNCGSPAAPNQNRCDFCESPLAVLSCPSCFALQFTGSTFCTQCGDKLERAARATDSQGGDCPRCNGSLEGRSVEQGSIEQCHDCGGVWLDHDVLETLIAKARSQQDLPTFLGKLPAPVMAVDTQAVKYLPCPECQTLMHRRNFGMRSGVIVDVCTAHGIWFDADELAAVIRFVKAGGEQGSLKRPTVAESTRSPRAQPTGFEPASRNARPDWSDLVSIIGDLIHWLR